jgi:hypothetical protein
MPMAKSKNEYIKHENHYILLVANRAGRTFETTFDHCDYETVSKYQYLAGIKKHTGIPHIKCRIDINNKKSYRYIHQIIMDTCVSGDLVDHVSGNTMDNRRVNLRLVSFRENAINRKSKQGMRGVYLTKNKKKYFSKIVHMGEQYYLGQFDSHEKALQVFYDKFKELNGFEHPRRSFSH